ncbi:MAG: WecB/TagA/CpsF family glycosyltransferase [Cucumibacter sp.]
MIDRGKRSVLGVGVNVIDLEAAVSRIIGAAQARQPLTATALAVHGVMTGALDPEHCFRLNRMDLATPDGQPVRWALRLLHGERLPDRVSGPELMPAVCARAAEEGLGVFFFGSSAETLRALTGNLTRAFPRLKIAGAEPSKFRQVTPEEAAAIDQRIRASGADIVFVGLGCPRQEVFAFEHASGLELPLVAVGAAFDFGAGTLSKAPRWMERGGLEWLFRLIQEPRRLWRRYLLLNPLYCAMIGAQLLRLPGIRFGRERRPDTSFNFG